MAAPTTTKSLGTAAMKRSASGTTLIDSGITTPARASLDTIGDPEHLNFSFGLHAVDSHKLSRNRALLAEHKKSRFPTTTRRRATNSSGAKAAAAKDFAKKVGRGIKTMGHVIKEALTEQPGDWDLPADHPAALKKSTKFQYLTQEEVIRAANARAKRILAKRATQEELARSA